MKYLTQLLRIVVGVLFIISGFVKIVDPIGFSYKLDEYFGPEVFNIPFLQQLALPMSVVFTIFEVLLGVLLLLGIWKKFTVYALLILIVFFSFLTFYSAYFNKVTDCGCFGDALKLEPWTSFWKDIVLLVMILIILAGIKYIKPLFSNKVNYALFGLSVIASVYITYQGIEHLPLIDFRPYAVGKSIPEGMKGGIPEKKEIIYTLKNSNSGKEQEMNDKKYIDSKIWEDSTWVIQENKTKENVISKGIPAPVHDFSIECNGEDQTKEYLSEAKVIIFTIPFVEKMNKKEMQDLTNITSELTKNRIKFVILSNKLEMFKGLNSCSMDPTTLKTINRSNPGMMVLKKGIVVAKYHHNDFPNIEEINKL